MEMPAQAIRLVAAVVTLGISVVYVFSPPVAQAQPSNTISGPQIEQLLRASLAPAFESTADPSQIRCPGSREYRDGDTVSCSVPIGNGSVEILLVTLYYQDGGWRFAVDIQ
jgi:hypothetical protein